MTVEKEYNVQALRGTEREQSLPKSAYFTDGYFSLPQLFSLSQQIHEIHAMKPASILEIGIGNGFVSTFLRHAGYVVKTADINPSLHPDICAPIHQVYKFVDGCTFDLVVCCEVLEHMPLEKLESNLEFLKKLGDRLFLTLPNYKRTFGFSGFFRVPKINPLMIRMIFDIMLYKKIDQEHFWEVGSCKKSSKREIMSLLSKHYNHIDTGQMLMNPYHLWFKAS